METNSSVIRNILYIPEGLLRQAFKYTQVQILLITITLDIIGGVDIFILMSRKYAGCTLVSVFDNIKENCAT